MDYVTLYWTYERIKWFRCSEYFLIDEGLTDRPRNYLDPSNYYLNDVKIIFDKIFAKIFDKNNVKTAIHLIRSVLCIVPVKFCPLDDPNDFVAKVEKYLENLGIRDVRFSYYPFFNATMVLRQIQKRCVPLCSGEKILMISSCDDRVCDLKNVYFIQKTDEGWRLKHKPIKYHGNLILSVLVACVKELDTKKIRHVVMLDNGKVDEKVLKIYCRRFSESNVSLIKPSTLSILDSARYLSELYTNARAHNTLDYYVPVCFHWPIQFSNNSVVAHDIFSEMDALPCTKIFPSPQLKSGRNIISVFTDKISREIELPAHIPVEVLRVRFAFGINGRYTVMVEKKSGKRYLPIFIQDQTVVSQFFPIVAISHEYIAIKCWQNGLLANLLDVNGLNAIPLKVSFVKGTPVVGSAAEDDGMFPVRHAIFRLFDTKWVREQIANGATDLCFGAEGKVNVIVKTPRGFMRTTPMHLLAVIIKSMVKLAEQKTGQTVVATKFDFFLPEIDLPFLPDVNLINELVYSDYQFPV